MLINALHQLDINLYFWVNHLPHNHFFNAIAILLHYSTRGMFIYIPLLVLFLLQRRVRQTVVIATSILLTELLADVILKPLVHRVRPFADLNNAIVLQPLPTTLSFPSAQTAVAFAVAMSCILIFENKKWRWLWVWAGLIAIDRIYMGHHYPSDVLAGAALGMVTSWVIFLISTKLPKQRN